MATYETAAKAWRDVRAGLERRPEQVHRRVDALVQYLQRAGLYERPTPGEKLAEKKAERARPELAANYQQFMEREKQARQREQDQRRATGTIQGEGAPGPGQRTWRGGRLIPGLEDWTEWFKRSNLFPCQ